MEVTGGKMYLGSVLGASTALLGTVTGIYDTQAPQGAVCPYLIYGLQSSVGESNVSGAKLVAELLFLVKAVTQGGDFLSGNGIMDIVDPLIRATGGTVTVGGVTYRILGCVREADVDYPEFINGIRYNHQGGLYRIPVCGTA